MLLLRVICMIPNCFKLTNELTFCLYSVIWPLLKRKSQVIPRFKQRFFVPPSHPERLGTVLQVHARDDPAVRGRLAAPQRLVKALPLGALQDLQASLPADLVDEPQAAPLRLLHNWTQQGAGDLCPRPSFCICVRLLVVAQSRVHWNKAPWNEKVFFLVYRDKILSNHFSRGFILHVCFFYKYKTPYIFPNFDFKY